MCTIRSGKYRFLVKWAKLTNAVNPRNYSKRVTDIPNVGFYSLPKKMGRTGHFINDGLRLISLGCKQKQKTTNTVQKTNTVLVASPRPPFSSQWVAVRIKAYIGDKFNPIQLTPENSGLFWAQTQWTGSEISIMNFKFNERIYTCRAYTGMPGNVLCVAPAVPVKIPAGKWPCRWKSLPVTSPHDLSNLQSVRTQKL